MNSKKKTMVMVIGALVLVLVLGAVYLLNRPKPASGSKQVSLVVRDDTGKETGYNVKTDASYLIEVMDELKAATIFDYEGTQGDYGLYITSVNGLTADYDKDQSYWAIYVNGEYGSYGAGEQPVNDGDAFVLAYEH